MYRGQFGHIRFSLNTQNNKRNRRITLIEVTQGSLGVARKFHRETQNSETISGVFSMINRYPRKVRFEECTAAKLNLFRMLHGKILASENANLLALVNKEHHRNLLTLEDLKASVQVAKQLKRSVSNVENATALLALGRSIQRKAELYEVVQGVFSVISYETINAWLDVTLQPGQEMRIDSDTFNALLEKENIIHLHTGEWIFLSRQVLEIVLRAGNGIAFGGQMIYVERYL